MAAYIITGVLRFVFFDVGNTLTFADTRLTLASLWNAGYHPTTAQLHAAERAAKLHLDAEMGDMPRAGVDHDYWNAYYTNLVQALGAPASLVPDLTAATRISGRWNQVRPGTRQLLEDLRRRGCRLGIISNTDPQITAMLAGIGLGDLFDSVTASAAVGYEKPHPEIFRAALNPLGAEPGGSVYVGDIYSVDYLGARAVGMRAVLMDVCGAYRDRGFPRIEALTELPALL
jgi:putative hydrolase of the HAD superfamily